jgi:gamma-glutamylcyclotransferase (GGCT)/AIG2-like uncharacterized protein YtfP
LTEADFANAEIKKELSEILQFQDGDGSFRYVTWDVSSDARVDFCYTPTYICAAILMKYRQYCRKTGETTLPGTEEALAGALEASCGRNLSGHGYEGTREQIAAMRNFIDGGLERFLSEDAALCPKFFGMIRRIISTYAELLEKGNARGAWGEDYAEELRVIARKVGSCFPRYYLAYGSNMSKEQMKDRCPTAKYVGVVFLEDYRLEFNRHATIEKMNGERAPAVLWELQEADEKSLDRYEGVQCGYYRKEYAAVSCEGQTVCALVYIMDKDGILKKGRGTPPDETYYEGIAKAYRDAGIDEV